MVYLGTFVIGLVLCLLVGTVGIAVHNHREDARSAAKALSMLLSAGYRSPSAKVIQAYGSALEATLMAAAMEPVEAHQMTPGHWCDMCQAEQDRLEHELKIAGHWCSECEQEYQLITHPIRSKFRSVYERNVAKSRWVSQGHDPRRFPG